MSDYENLKKVDKNLIVFYNFIYASFDLMTSIKTEDDKTRFNQNQQNVADTIVSIHSYLKVKQ